MNKYITLVLGLFLVAGLSFYSYANPNRISSERAYRMDTIIVPDGFYIPNVLTPNGDGINDVLVISCSSVSNFYFQVYTRDGQEIFESSSINISWDGRTNAGVKVSDGTYFYVLRATTATGEVWDKTGYITVLGSRAGGNE